LTGALSVELGRGAGPSRSRFAQLTGTLRRQPGLARRRQGARVLSTGDRVGVAEVGLLATVGAVALRVRPTPKVAVLSTGELLCLLVTGGSFLS
jgi:hypothetical protein